MQEPSSREDSPAEILTWCRRYLPHIFKTGSAAFHEEIITMLLESERVAVAAPRGHAKSVVVSLGYVLYQLAHRRARFVVIVSASSTLAEEHVGNIYNECVENVELLRDYPHLRVPNPKERADKKSKARQSDFMTIGRLRVVAKGAGARMRGMRDGGQRPDLLVLDDLEDDKLVQTPRQRQKLKDWFLKSVSNLFGGSGGQLAVVGTIMHREALMAWLVGDTAPPRYVKRKYAAYLGDGSPLWPEEWDAEKLKVKLDEVGSRAFATEYLNNPAEDDAVLFKSAWIDSNRLKVPAGLSPGEILAHLKQHGIELARVVVALDPSTSADGQRDACGINVSGMSRDGRFYVLADLTLNASPATWARKALDAHKAWDCDEIVAEANQGGAMIESTLKAELHEGERLPPVRLVHATRGKAIRAEPIAVEYERNNVHHVGVHGPLEVEMVTWVPGTYSPNRLDALVWALKRLTESTNTDAIAALEDLGIGGWE